MRIFLLKNYGPNDLYNLTRHTDYNKYSYFSDWFFRIISAISFSANFKCIIIYLYLIHLKMEKFANRFLRGWDFDEIFGSLDIQSLNNILYDEHSKVTRTTEVHYTRLYRLPSQSVSFSSLMRRSKQYAFTAMAPTDRIFHAFVVIKTAEH